jgi:gliding motility-associated-like protein
VAGTLTIVPLTNTDLTSLAISSGSLSPVFNTNTFAYNVTVDNATANLTLTPTFAITASATVNGTTVVNGGPSFGMPLNVGNNIITLIVTAQDGITKKTYTLNVYRGLDPISITASNILTPNGDGKNDTWVIKDIELYPQNMVTVYDKAGRVVYTKRGYRNEWDGTLSGAPLAQGTYYYTVNLGPYMPDFKGFITILKDH